MLTFVGRVAALSALGIGLLSSAAQAAEPADLGPTLERIASAIKRAKYKRVGVAPSFVRVYNAQRPDTNAASSPLGMYFAEAAQAGLVGLQGDDFEVVNADILMSALRAASVDTLQDLEKLGTVAEKVGGLDAIVVGTVKPKQNVDDEGMQTSATEISCKLVDIKTGSDKAISSADHRKSLAEAVYEGQSAEIMRWSQGRLLPIGFIGLAMDSQKQLPLSPKSPEDDFDLWAAQPMPNPNCPFAVGIEAEGEKRELVYHPRLDNPHVALAPGEQFAITVTNASGRPVNVAVFVDGLNILGKRRELPDENCHFWTLDKPKGTFRGFYELAEAGDTVEPFRMVAAEDAVATQQNFTDRLGLITVVVFNQGWPTQNDFVRKPYSQYVVQRTWDPARAAWDYQEGWEQVAGAIAGAAPGAGRLGVGADRRERVNLGRGAAKGGPILAAMSIQYATRSEIADLTAASESANP